jgi:hypothetical protein
MKILSIRFKKQTFLYFFLDSRRDMEGHFDFKIGLSSNILVIIGKWTWTIPTRFEVESRVYMDVSYSWYRSQESI